MIYFMKHLRTGLVKIGCTGQLHQRHRQLRSMMNDFNLEVIATISGRHKRETFLHKTFKHLEDNNEMFRHVADLKDLIDCIRDGSFYNDRTELEDGTRYLVINRVKVLDKTEFCEFCGERHNHGESDGHRVAHCLPMNIDNDLIRLNDENRSIISYRDGYLVKTDETFNERGVYGKNS